MLTAVVFFGAAVTACIALGVVGLIVVLTNRAGARGTPREGALPALIASACMLVLGVALTFEISAEASYRVVVPGFAFALGLTFLFTSGRLKSREATIDKSTDPYR